MLSSNAFRSASLAVLAATGMVGGAMAADMPAPPPPMMHHAPPPMDVGGGFYLRGDVGIGLYDHKTIETLPKIASLKTVESSISGTGFVGVGAGYMFNSWLRTDATIEYRASAKHRHVDSWGPHVLPGTPGGSGANLITGRMSAIVGLANAYVDLGTWNRITPFVGAGIGFASIHMNGPRDVNLTTLGSVTGVSKTQTRMAWALHAGLGYDLTANWKAEVAYRYLNLGDVESGRVTCAGAPPSCPYTVKIKNLQSHDLKFGMRYVFAEAPMMAPGPLIRKY